MSTHAYALMPGGGVMLDTPYWMKYFRLGKHSRNLRILKEKILLAGFITLSLLHHINYF